MENNIEVLKQTLKSFGYRNTSSPMIFEKPLGFTKICAKIKYDNIDKGLMLNGEVVALRNEEKVVMYKDSSWLLYYNTEEDDIDWNTKLNMKDLSRVIAQFEADLMNQEDLLKLNYFYINKEFTPLNFITQMEMLELEM